MEHRRSRRGARDHRRIWLAETSWNANVDCHRRQLLPQRPGPRQSGGQGAGRPGPGPPGPGRPGPGPPGPGPRQSGGQGSRGALCAAPCRRVLGVSAAAGAEYPAIATTNASPPSAAAPVPNMLETICIDISLWGLIAWEPRIALLCGPSRSSQSETRCYELAMPLVRVGYDPGSNRCRFSASVHSVNRSGAWTQGVDVHHRG
ncbi:hypothetical protein DSM43276_02940 [Mycobacteroides salmoniphilum]|nr:hypothetical protein DSM43276_02940 [Mycobacteroides salmoniphilum]